MLKVSGLRPLCHPCRTDYSGSVPRKAFTGCAPSAPRGRNPDQPGLRRHRQRPGAGAAPQFDPSPSVEELKAQLLDSFFDVERGLRASSETGAEISELISQLEARNPTDAPNEAAELLSGTWKLVYTANSELLPLLALARLPLTKVGDITQVIDASTQTFQNKVVLESLVTRGQFSVNARFQVRSPTRLEVKFEEGTVSSPEIVRSPEFPATATLLGRPIDLTSLRDALQPVNSVALGAFGQLRQLVNQQPDIQFPIRGRQAQTWLLNTYLDEDLRISRGDGSSIFVLVKDFSTQLVDKIDIASTQLSLPAAGQSAAT